MTELKDRILAGQLRRRFEGHPAPARIARLMSDDELIARWHLFTNDAVAHEQAKTNVVTSRIPAVVPEVPLNTLYQKALETL
jgi:hypothetical protein